MPESHVNLFAGSPLNRLSWLRSSHAFLNAVVSVPSARWIVFNGGQPLRFSASDRTSDPVFFSTHEVKSFLGPEPYFGQAGKPGDLLPNRGSDEPAHGPHTAFEGARHLGLPIVFLGIDEGEKSDSTGALPTSEFTDPQTALEKLEGTPYFSVDIASLNLSEEKVQEILSQTTLVREGSSIAWTEPRSHMMGIGDKMAAILGSARSMTDWNVRNKFCPACGTPTYSLWGGWKINCRSLLPWTSNTGKPCPTGTGLHNFTHPRTDAVVIMIAIDETGDKVLLGRSNRFPSNFYSALAGFIEPGESLENAVAREMWEEAGVHVWNATYHSGQPWPFPANLMLGFYARADSTKPIRTDLDNELADARWFTREEVLTILNHSLGTRLTSADNVKLETKGGVPPPGAAATVAQLRRRGSSASAEALPFRIPPTSAIAGVLIRDWAEGKIGFPDERVVGGMAKLNL